ncbi:MAG: type II toxin-antitoxin system RelE/ParE family toxin [Kordiimonadaceae bacterium]|jgi:toxin ParE1/3/4|nr:type II toxin-antitoxin system RelE/ParE family toxin [Kordiimonadaceae bacterium]
MGEITFYKLSSYAEDDVSSIYDYTVAEHGKDQATKYLMGLEESLTGIIDFPESGHKRSEIRQGLRSIIYQHHIIFYRLHDDYIRIVRILHKSSDLPRFLQDI